MDFNRVRPDPLSKPKPPPCSLQCGFCGYAAPKPDYKHTCYSAILLGVVLLMMPIGLLVAVLIKLGLVT